MTQGNQVHPQGEQLRKALRWIGETQIASPDKKRESLLREAEIRFNLTPKECEFLENNFS